MGRRSVLQSIREAIAGSPQFTEGSLSRAITLLAIPMVLEIDDGIVLRDRRRFLRSGDDQILHAEETPRVGPDRAHRQARRGRQRAELILIVLVGVLHMDAL